MHPPGWNDFLDCLPIDFPMGGYVIRVRRREGGLVGVKVTPEIAPDRNRHCMRDRKGEVIVTSADEVRTFLSFYLNTSVGPRVMTLGNHEGVNEKRLHVVTCTFDSWRRLNGARDKMGRLKQSMTCIAFVDREDKRYVSWCQNLTKERSGLCRFHNSANAKTYFNDGALQWVKAMEHNERFDPREAEFNRQKARWEHVAAGINCSASDRQIYLLLDLGARPEDLEGLDRRRASRMIDRLLDAKYGRES